MDSKLQSEGVFFLPWIGKDYGSNPNEPRLLILGESHYSLSEEETPDLTRACVCEHANREWNHRFFTMLTQIVSGKDHWELDRAQFWGGISFYNYVQRSVGESWGVAPDGDAYSRDERAFRTVVSQLRPTHVLVCSWRLWDQLPGRLFDREIMPIADRFKVREMTTTPSVLAMGIPHPSRVARAPATEAIQCFLSRAL